MRRKTEHHTSVDSRQQPLPSKEFCTRARGGHTLSVIRVEAVGGLLEEAARCSVSGREPRRVVGVGMGGGAVSNRRAQMLLYARDKAW